MIAVDALPLFNGHRKRGVGEYVRLLIASLRQLPEADRARLDIRILCADREPCAYGFPVLRTWRPERPGTRFTWLVNALMGRYDFRHARGLRLFHVTDPNGLQQPPRGTRLYTAHDLIPLRFSEQYLARASAETRFGYRRVLRAYQRAEHILAISHATKADLIDLLGIPEHRIHVVHPGTDVTRIAARFHARRDQAEPELPAKFFLYAGGLDWRKNIFRLVESFASVAKHLDEDLVLAGPASSAELQQLRQWSRKLGVDRRVRHLGMVSNAVLGRLYRNATALVFVSLYEGFGLPLIEAMAVECPIICSNRGASPEVAGDAAMVVDGESTDAIAGAMVRLADDPSLRGRLKAEGLARLPMFDLATSGRRLADTYDAILR